MTQVDRPAQTWTRITTQAELGVEERFDLIFTLLEELHMELMRGPQGQLVLFRKGG